MSNNVELQCDGCGQIASAEHTARRLQRLEWTTRYRPVHIHVLLLGAFSPFEERDFLYSPKGEFCGEAALLLAALGFSAAGKTAEAVHAEFQRAGYFLTHVLECPIEKEAGKPEQVSALLAKHLPAVGARIRRSLKPKRVMLVTKLLEPIVDTLVALPLGCPIVLDNGKPFELDGLEQEKAVGRLREALGAHPGD